jgi:Sigma-70 factor, region 1.
MATKSKKKPAKVKFAKPKKPLRKPAPKKAKPVTKKKTPPAKPAPKTTKTAEKKPVAKAPGKAKAVPTKTAKAPFVEASKIKGGGEKTAAAPTAGKNRARAATVEAAPAMNVDKFIADKTRELVKLSKDQGYLTFDDLEENLPAAVNDPDVIDKIITRLREVEIELIEQSDIDTDKAPRKEEEKEEKAEKKTNPTAASIFSTIPSACISNRWAKSLCSPVSRRSRFPNASKTPMCGCRTSSTAWVSWRGAISIWPRNFSTNASALIASSWTKKSKAVSAT